MPTVRFSQVVSRSGSPEPHLVLADPDTDHPLQKAIKENRVATVFQTMVGNATDHAEVGFHEGPARQYLVFPKSVRRFSGQRIVGIKYDLLESGLVNAPAKPQAAPAKRKSARSSSAPKVKRTPAASSQSPKTKRPKKPTAPQPKPARPVSKKSSQKSPTLRALKARVRQAMRKLEAGQQVAAFHLLQQIIDEP